MAATSSKENQTSLTEETLSGGAAGTDDDGEGAEGESAMAAICAEFELEMHVLKTYRKAFKVFDADGSNDIDERELSHRRSAVGRRNRGVDVEC